MSAIYGIIHKNGNPVSQETAHIMASAMRHRAIDGEGSWHEGNILLGQCMLTFKAADKSWRVPLVTDDLIIVADIRIDNSPYIRKLTNSPKEATDLELLLAAFRMWGQHCVYYLNGEFAFCIWEREHNRLFLATDRVGFKSLFYYDTPDMFIFCTEQKGLLAVKPLPHYFNEESLITYHFRDGDPVATHTKYVYALLGGYGLTLEDRCIRQVRYWNPSPGKYSFDDGEECALEMRQLLTTVIKNRISTDRPIGITLSGGLDSSSIACLLAKELASVNKPLYAFSSVLPETAQGKDERAYIERILRHCPNIIPTFVDAPACGPFDDISDAFDYDETFPNPFFYMDHAILRAAKEKGVGVLFTGYGGDHWVSWQGHTVIYNMLAAGRYQLVYQLIMEFAEREQRHPLQIVKRELAAQTSVYRALRGRNRKSLNGTALRKGFIRKYRQMIDLRPVRDVFKAMMDNISNGRVGILPALLSNRNEAYGIISAVPLLDRTVLEYMMDVPDQMFVYNGHKRSLIRHAMDGIVPDEVLSRKDKGKYSPDFMARSQAGIPRAGAMIQSPEYALAFEKYLSKPAMSQLADGTELSTIRLIQGIISSQVISILQKNGYLFEGNFS